MIISKNRTNNILSILATFAITLCVFSNNIYAQQQQQFQQQQEEVRTDFSEEKLQNFVEVAQNVMIVQQESQQNMVSGIEDEGLTVEEFNQMFESMQNPETEVEATAEEQEAFDKAMENVNVVQQEADEDIIEIIEEGGLTQQEYEEIMMAYQQDPELQQKVNELMQQQ